jgi:hypothetical protein
LVDSGASYSIIPHTSSSPPSGPRLLGPDGAAIKCWGRQELPLKLAGRQFTWSFLRAAVSFPIIGIDFLIHHGLLLDAARGRLSAASAGTSIPLSRQPSGPTAAILLPEPAAAAATAPAPAAAPAAISSPTSFQALLAQFPAVLNPSKRLPPTSHGVQHHLLTQGPPVASPFRRLDPEKLAAAKAEFATLERDGIVRRSNSPWASPLHMVRKADGSWRPCGDYRRLNGVTVPDTYPLPNMMDFTARMSGCQFFSKVDLRK